MMKQLMSQFDSMKRDIHHLRNNSTGPSEQKIPEIHEVTAATID